MISVSRLMQDSRRPCLIAVFLLCMAGTVCAQSTELNFPTPVRSAEVEGKISARDLGDSRLTDHFYAFTGTPGDVLITVTGTNLNGDVDVFTASGLKPLLKFALYAETSAPITKSIYLRRREDLLVRIEARTPNDDEGIYHLRFGGSFEPIIGGAEVSENAAPTELPATATSGKKTRRVNSVGARIEEPPAPVAEVAAAPTPEPTPVEATPEAAKEKPADLESSKPPPAKVPRAPRRSTGRRTARSAATKPKEGAADKKSNTTESTETSESQPVPKPTSRSKSRRSTVSESAAKTAEAVETPAAAEADSGPRLVIQTNGGTLINRPMSGVRRVTVENGLVFVVGKDGRTLRLQLANIVKMSIEP
jgi:outer membrane biosynthesis protein TonB